MRVLVVEDELGAADCLQRLVLELEPATEIVGNTSSVTSTSHWLENNQSLDLVFMDIRLEGSDRFAILAKRRVDSPFVFCTAYSDYALQAFAANSIDYLLKPVVRKDLSRALRKYQRFSGFRMVSGDWLEFPAEGAANGKRVTYRKQFLVALAGQFTQVRSADVVAVGSYLKGRQLIDKSGRQWVLDAALEEAERALHPDEFCRICRKWLVRLSPVSSLVRTADEYKVAVTGLAAPVNV